MELENERGVEGPTAERDGYPVRESRLLSERDREPRGGLWRSEVRSTVEGTQGG